MLIVRIRGTDLPIPITVEHQGADAVQRYIDDKTKVADRLIGKKSKTTAQLTEE